MQKQNQLQIFLYPILIFALVTCVFYLYYTTDSTAWQHQPQMRLISRDVEHYSIRRVSEDTFEMDVEKIHVQEMSMSESLKTALELNRQVERDFKALKSGAVLSHMHNYRPVSAGWRKYAGMNERRRKPGSVIPPGYFNSKKRYSYAYKYLLNNAQLCNVEDMFLIVPIISDLRSSYLRRTVRENIAKLNMVYGKEVRFVFFVGKDPFHNYEDSSQYLLKQESFQHRDIVQFNFNDAYRNHTIKTICVLRWLSDFCPNAKYIIRITDHVIFDIFRFVKFLLRDEMKKENLMWGQLKRSPVRMNYSDFQSNTPTTFDPYVSNVPWTGKYYPPYLARPYLLMTPDVVDKLYAMALRTPPMSPDYVMLAILAKKIGIQFASPKGFFADFGYKETSIRLMTVGTNGSRVMFGNFPNSYSVPQKIQRVWSYIERMTRDKTNCKVWIEKATGSRMDLESSYVQEGVGNVGPGGQD